MSELLLNPTSNPGTPATGKLAVWENTTNDRLWFTDSNGNQAPVGGATQVFNVEDYGIYPTSNANYNPTTNVTNLNTLLQTIAPAGSAIFFPPGTYGFASGLTTLTKDFAFIGIRGFSYIAITSNVTGNWLTWDGTGYYTSCEGLIFNQFANLTGYWMECQNDVSPEFTDCQFNGTGYTMGGAIDFTGTTAGDLAFFHNVIIQGFTGTGINVASPLDTIQGENLVIIGSGSTSAYGINMTNGGACLLSDSQIIKCNVDLALQPTVGLTVSAVKLTNCFLDQGVVNALLISGAGTVLRCTFVNTWFTASGVGASPTCIATNTTGSSVHGGLIFNGCTVLNATTGSTGTLTGMSIAAVSDVQIEGGEFAGWTNAINVAGNSSNTTDLIIGGGAKIGASGGVATNGTGITLSGTFANINIQGNTISGNSTAPLADTSTAVAGGQKVIADNIGLNAQNNTLHAALGSFNTTETVIINQPVPPASRQVGSMHRITIDGTFTNTTTTGQTTTFTLRAGTAGTVADASIGTIVVTAANAAAGTAIPFRIVIDVTVTATGASGTGNATAVVTNQGAATQSGIAAFQVDVIASALTAWATSTASYLTVTGKTSATTNSIASVTQAIMEEVKL